MGKNDKPDATTSLLSKPAYTHPMLALTVALVLSRPTYKHDSIIIRDGDGNPVHTMLKVLRTDGSLVWKRGSNGRADVIWSADRRAIAIYGDLGFLTTWVAGGKVQRTRLPSSNGPWEAPEDFAKSASWSPDSRRLLFIFPRTQGDMIIGHGELVVLNLQTRRQQLLGYVDQAKWVNERTVRYKGRRFIVDEIDSRIIPFGPIDKQVN